MNSSEWVPLEHGKYPPTPHGRYAGIGATILQADYGAAAICRLYERSPVTQEGMKDEEGGGNSYRCQWLEEKRQEEEARPQQQPEVSGGGASAPTALRTKGGGRKIERGSPFRRASQGTDPIIQNIEKSGAGTVKSLKLRRPQVSRSFLIAEPRPLVLRHHTSEYLT